MNLLTLILSPILRVETSFSEPSPMTDYLAGSKCENFLEDMYVFFTSDFDFGTSSYSVNLSSWLVKMSDPLVLTFKVCDMVNHGANRNSRFTELKHGDFP